jgi:hypothetical protein
LSGYPGFTSVSQAAELTLTTELNPTDSTSISSVSYTLPLNSQLPTFFVIGSPKCGTSSLHAYLNLHPEISMSSLKEPRYFCRNLKDFDLTMVPDRDLYLSLFATGTPHRGESTTTYSSSGRYPGIPEAIHGEIRNPKFVYMVRDPVERVASSVQQMGTARESIFRQQYAEAVDSDSDILKSLAGDLEEPRNWHVDEGRYMKQIRQYLEYFPEDSILVVDSADLRSRREETVNHVLGFLDLDPLDNPEDLAFELNTSSEKIRDAAPYLALANTSALRRIVDRLPPGPRRSSVDYLRRVTSKPVPKMHLDHQFREQLKEFFRPEVESLRAFTGQSFSTWSI